MYYIYHIPTFVHKDGSIGKIGCTVQEPKVRVKNQGYSSFEILETYDCIDSASKREIELQREYGYKVDCSSYVQTKKIRDESHKTKLNNGHYKRMQLASNISKRKGVVMIDKQKYKPLKQFISVADASRYLNKKNGTSCIAKCCRGEKKSAYGYFWKYKD